MGLNRQLARGCGRVRRRPNRTATIGASLKELDVFPSFEENPDFYIDYGETGPYVAEIGESECAT